MYKRKIREDLDCGVVVAMKVFGGKWKLCIIDAINRGFRRPSELHREIYFTSPRVIDMQLSELMEYGVVTKKAGVGFPLYVEYSLTPLGKSILPILEQLATWGMTNMDFVKEVAERQSGEDALPSRMTAPYLHEGQICR